jgi:uncharacterized protein
MICRFLFRRTMSLDNPKSSSYALTSIKKRGRIMTAHSPITVLSFNVDPFAEEDYAPVDTEKVISGTPRQAFRVLYTSASEDFCTGIYACTPGKWRVSYTEDEFCTLTSGSIILTNADGNVAQRFNAPDSFLIPSGFSGTWEALTAVQKNFVIYEKTG